MVAEQLPNYKQSHLSEVNEIVSGRKPIEQNELFLKISFKVRGGSKVSAIFLGAFALVLFIMSFLFGKAWLQCDNPVDGNIFGGIALAFFLVATLGAYFTHKLHKKVKVINNTDNFGIWLTKKHLICHDGEGIKYIPTDSIISFDTYTSNRPPLKMVLVRAKKPYNTLRLVCNWLTENCTQQELIYKLKSIYEKIEK